MPIRPIRAPACCAALPVPTGAARRRPSSATPTPPRTRCRPPGAPRRPIHRGSTRAPSRRCSGRSAASPPSAAACACAPRPRPARCSPPSCIWRCAMPLACPACRPACGTSTCPAPACAAWPPRCRPRWPPRCRTACPPRWWRPPCSAAAVTSTASAPTATCWVIWVTRSRTSAWRGRRCMWACTSPAPSTNRCGPMRCSWTSARKACWRSSG